MCTLNVSKAGQVEVTLLVINADRRRSFDFNVPTSSERYTLTAKQVEESTVHLNGKPLLLTNNGDLSQLEGASVNARGVNFAPTSITYLSIADAARKNCH